MSEFLYEMKQNVLLNQSLEEGFIVGRAQYLYSENYYLLRYVTANGRQCENWWPESCLKAREGKPV